ncbi:hypothetical protein GCM10027167_64350 [Nocardia heshunensis]
MDNADLWNVDLAGSVLAHADFYHAHTASPDKSVPWTVSVFTEADLSGAIFDQSDLTNALFLLTDTSGASFVASLLSNTTFDRADLTSTKWEQANLSGACFVDSDLSHSQFAYPGENLQREDDAKNIGGARFVRDKTANIAWPHGFTPPASVDTLPEHPTAAGCP